MNMKVPNPPPTSERPPPPPAPPAIEPKKKRSNSKPTQRTLEHLRDAGAMPQVVERMNMHAKPFPRRVDLFGFIDVVAIVPDRIGVTGIQCTTSFGGGFMARIHKVMDEQVMNEKEKRLEPNPVRAKAIRWIRAGNRVLFHGWRKGAAGRWKLDERELLEKEPGVFVIVKADGEEVSLAGRKQPKQYELPETPF